MQLTFLSMLVVCVSAECSGPHCHKQIDDDATALLQTKSEAVKGSDRSEKAACNPRAGADGAPEPMCLKMAFMNLKERDRVDDEEYHLGTILGDEDYEGVKKSLNNGNPSDEKAWVDRYEILKIYDAMCASTGDQLTEGPKDFEISGPDADDKCTERICFYSIPSVRNHNIRRPLFMNCKRTSTGIFTREAGSTGSCTCDVDERFWKSAKGRLGHLSKMPGY